MLRQRLEIGASSATSVCIAGRTMLSFAGCNYLGLAHHPRVIESLAAGLEQHGISSGASRETTGNSAAHEELERDAAGFLASEAALLAADGYLANLVVAQALEREHDLVLVDERSHASIRDALAAAGWNAVEYEHASASSAAGRLREARSKSRVAIFTDGVFPALRSVAPLRDLLGLLPADGGTLVVDDAHATGVLGRDGAGTCQHLGLSDPRIVITTTLSKALGCFGGLIAGTSDRIRAARERSRAFVCSSPIPPALARAGSAAIGEIRSDPSRLARLRGNVAHLRARFTELRLPVPAADLPVFPFALDSVESMQRVHGALIEQGILAPYIRYPDGMDDRRGYFRIALSAEHTRADIERLSDALARVLPERQPGALR